MYGDLATEVAEIKEYWLGRAGLGKYGMKSATHAAYNYMRRSDGTVLNKRHRLASAAQAESQIWDASVAAFTVEVAERLPVDDWIFGERPQIGDGCLSAMQLKGPVQATFPQGFGELGSKKHRVRFPFAASFALFVHKELAIEPPSTPNKKARRRLLSLSVLLREYSSWLMSKEGSAIYEFVLSLTPSAQARAQKARASTAIEEAPKLSRTGTSRAEGGSMTLRLVAPHPDPEDKTFYSDLKRSVPALLNRVLGMHTRQIFCASAGGKIRNIYFYPLYKKNFVERSKELWWEGL